MGGAVSDCVTARGAWHATSELNTKLAQYPCAVSCSIKSVRPQVERKAVFCVSRSAPANRRCFLKESNRPTSPRQKDCSSESRQAAANDHNVRCRAHVFRPPIPITFERRKKLQAGLGC